MDFQNLGKHCSDSTCRQKDFLPFTCKFCSNIYCLDHRAFSAHSCPKANTGDHKVVLCPICLKTVTFDAGSMTESECFAIHNSTECKAENYSKVKAEKAKACRAKGCKTKLTPLNTNMCRGCRKELCLKHRYEDQHECVYEAQPKLKVKEEPTVAPKPQQHNNRPVVQQGSCGSQYMDEFCTVCGRGFTNLDELISHAQLAHY